MAIAPHPPRRRREIPDSQIGLLATRIRDAAHFLIHEKGWSLVQIEAHLDMHKNSTMRIKDLRSAWTVRRRISSSSKGPWRGGAEKFRFVEAQEGDTGDDGLLAQPTWLWNPQIDTLERLERLIHLAEAEGFDSRRPSKPKVWPKKSTGRKKTAATNGEAEQLSA